MVKIAVSMATLKSHNHIVDDIERGVKIFEGGGIEISDAETIARLDLKHNTYIAKVPHKKNMTKKTVWLTFSKDGQDLDWYICDCTMRYGKNLPVCRHITAAVLAIQGGVVE